MANPATAVMQPVLIWPAPQDPNIMVPDIPADESWEGDILLTNYMNDDSYLLLDYGVNEEGYEWVLCCDLATLDMGWICLGNLLISDTTQNTLFLDSSIDFEGVPFTSVPYSWEHWEGGDIRPGTPQSVGIIN